MTNYLYKCIDFYLIVVEMSEKNFDQIEYWMNEIKENPFRKDLPTLFVVSKGDKWLESENFSSKLEEIKKISEKYESKFFGFVSSKTCLNLDEIFHSIAIELIEGGKKL